jgi:hypothetical protein
VAISRLQKALGANGTADAPADVSVGGSVLLTRGHGYLLQVAPGELDVERFGEMAERGRGALAAGRPEEAARLLRDALRLWRGPPLSESLMRWLRTASRPSIPRGGLSAVKTLAARTGDACARAFGKNVTVTGGVADPVRLAAWMVRFWLVDQDLFEVDPVR